MVKRGLVISDLHAPYQHPDGLPFLYRVKDIFGPFTDYFSVGDETDGHGWSYHEPDPSLPNSDLEFEMARKFMKQLYEFTEHKCKVMKSNHGALAYRKSKTGRIPSQIMAQAYERALDAPPGWSWHQQYIAETIRGPVLLHHGFSSSNSWLVAKERGMSVITGHHHTKFSLHQEYVHSLNRTIYAAQIGCLIDVNSDAFKYAENNKEKQRLGVLVLLDGVPILVSMNLNNLGRWVGRL